MRAGYKARYDANLGHYIEGDNLTAKVSLPDLEERMRQLTRDIIIEPGTAGYKERRVNAERKLAEWFAERGIALVDLTNAYPVVAHRS